MALKFKGLFYMKIIFNHPSFIITEKPHDISFHSDDGDGFMSKVKSDLQIELFSVHRLDKVTSGLVIFAKTSDAASIFGNLFSTRSIVKTYLALAKGKPNKKQGLVSGDMTKSRRGTYKLLRSKDNPAVTKFTSASYDEGIRLYTLKPHTGKTHQLRVMMKSIGVPILGDTSYSGEHYKRVCLHAHKLEFLFENELFIFESYPSFLDKKKHLN
jgi:tRNA pseudouridine32 synthase/23S rRNA pseudouridine746 synthase